MHVLFVCVENSNRSQMAQAFARMEASDKGWDELIALSAGSSPSGRVNPRAIESMRELGYDLASHESTSLDVLPDMEFDCVVTMGCGDACPQIGARRREDWEIPDPRDLEPAEFRKVRDRIRCEVAELLQSLHAESGT